MQSRTSYLARFLGLFALVLCCCLLANRTEGARVIQAVLTSLEAKFTYGFIALAMGVAMLLGHQVWRGGVLPVVVTLIGWMALIKGVVLLVVPADALARAFEVLDLARTYPLVLTAPLVLGLYLTWAGFCTGSSALPGPNG